MLEPEGVKKYRTPKPNKKKTSSEYHADLEEDEDESVFVSPLKARKNPPPVANSDGELTGTDNGGPGEAKTPKRKGNKKTDTGKRAFRDMVQEKRAMTTTANNKRTLIEPAGNSKARLSTSNF